MRANWLLQRTKKKFSGRADSNTSRAVLKVQIDTPHVFALR